MRYGEQPASAGSAWSPVHPSYDGVDARDRRDHVSDHAALAQRRHRLQVVEGGVAEMRPVGPGAAVADGVAAEFALGRLDGRVRLSWRHAEPLGDQLEVVDERFHGLAHDVGDVLGSRAQAVGAEGQLRGPADLGVRDHHRVVGGPLAGEPAEALVDDLERLLDLVHPDHVPAVGVAGVHGGHVELVGFVTAVRLALAQVPRQPGAAQHRPRHAERDAALQVEVGDALRPGDEDRVGVDQLAQVADEPGRLPEELPDLADRAWRQVLGHTARPDVGVVHPQAGDQLEQVEHPFTEPQALQEDRGGAELHAERAEAAEVGGDPVELHHQHPDDLRPLGDLVLDAEQLLHRQAVRHLVEDRHQVVRPGAERDALRPGAVLHVLLDAGVQVPDADPDLCDGLAVQGEDEPQHPMRGRVLGAHVDDQVTGAWRVGHLVRGGDDLVPVLAGHRVHAALGGAVVRARRPRRRAAAAGAPGGGLPGITGVYRGVAGGSRVSFVRGGHAYDLR